MEGRPHQEKTTPRSYAEAALNGYSQTAIRDRFFSLIKGPEGTLIDASLNAQGLPTLEELASNFSFETDDEVQTKEDPSRRVFLRL